MLNILNNSLNLQGNMVFNRLKINYFGKGLF
jgi:hypothetical protein